MLELPSHILDNLTGHELVERVTEARRSNGQDPNDLSIDGHLWKLYTVAQRGQPPTVHLWRTVEMPLVIGGADTGERTTEVVHLQGRIDRRVEEMRAVERT